MEYETEKKVLKGRKLFFFIYFLALILVLTVIGFMGTMGYHLVNAGMTYLLFGLLVVSAVIALGWWISTKIPVKWLKTVFTIAGSLLVLVLIAVMIALFQMLLLVQTPLHFNTLLSEDHPPVVLMRQLNADENRINARYAARGVEFDPENASTNDLGYLYTAHPRFLRFFYNSNVKPEGELEIGSASQAELMFEWQDNTIRLYIENPEAGDEGELRLTFE